MACPSFQQSFPSISRFFLQLFSVTNEDTSRYMGGFTRPQDLRISNWFPGGAYVKKGKVYESPPEAAYESHTVYLLEARYPTKHGVGRADSIEHVVGVCREGDLPAIIEKYNSPHCPKDEREVMDNALWPWLPSKRSKTVSWCDPGEQKKDVLARRHEEIYGEHAAESGLSIATPSVPLDLSVAPPAPATGSLTHRRAFHSSARACASEPKAQTPKTTAGQRAKIDESSWTRPHKPSQDADDNVVPAYYVERKRQLDDIAERKEEEGGLMAQLSAGIISEGIAAQTRVREGKVPVEIVEEDGTVRLPSGFEPPTPATDFHPVVAMPPAEDDTPILTAEKVSWDEALVPAEDAVAGTSAAASSGPSGSRGFHTSAVARAKEIPMNLLDHTPPAPPARARDASPRRNVKANVKAKAAAQPQKEFAEEEEDDDDLDIIESVDDLVEGGVPPVTDSAAAYDDVLSKHRKRYFATLKDEPFWRPVLTMTFSTRPLAVTAARLSRALPRGLPFYASIDEADRKISATYSSRISQLRYARMRSLALEIAKRLRGDFGGFPGIRFETGQRGRGINGEGLDAPIPFEKRVVQIGVGEWHKWGKSLQELIKDEVQENELEDGVRVFGIDEWGKRTDGVEWKQPNVKIAARNAFNQFMASPEMQNLTNREKEARLEAYLREHGRDVATQMTQASAGVTYARLEKLP